MNSGKVLRSSLGFALAAIVLNTAILAGAYAIAGGMAGFSAAALFFGVMIFSYMANLAVYLLAGFFSGRDGMSVMDGGAVACAAFSIALSVTSASSALLSVFLFSSSSAGQDGGGTEGLVLLGFFGAVSLAMSAINYLMTLLAGLFINFFAGALGAYIGSRKS